MVRFYGGSGGSDSSSSSSSSGGFSDTISGGKRRSSFETDAFDDVGKTDLDLTGPQSVGEALGNLGDFFSGLGQVGIPGGPNLGGVAEVATIPARFPLEVAGNALGALGSIELPYLGNDPTRTNAHLGDVPGAMVGGTLEALSLPSRAVERTVAGRKAEGTAEFFRRHPTQDQREEFLRLTGMPEDLAQDLQDGKITVDQFADELVARNAGFSSNPIENVAGQIVLDPLNFILPGASMAVKGAKTAGLGIRAGETLAELGIPKFISGKVYNGITKGMSAAGAATVDRVLGPATSGVYHSIGTKAVFGIRNGLGSINPAYADTFDEALAKGAAQFTPAVIARVIGDEARLAIKLGATKAVEALRATPIAEALSGRVKSITHDRLQRMVEEMADRTIPHFLRATPEQMLDETSRKLATITGMSVEDATRALGGKVTRQQARAVHLAFYGKAGSDLAKAKALAGAAKFGSGRTAEDLTIIGPQTLTDERADILLEAIQKGDGAAVEDAVANYEVLARKFGGKEIDNAKVAEYIKNLKANDALPQAVRLPKTGKNPLPSSLSEWRAKYADSGYEIGFGPKDGWKSVIDETGEVHITEPFVHFVDEADPLTHRNPLGRMVDGLFRGVTQTKIIQSAKTRFVAAAVTKGTGITDAEADRLFGAILSEARRHEATPRGLGGTAPYDAIFEDILGPQRMAELRKTTTPTWLVMKAFEGNLREVGLTQKFTGAMKTIFSGAGNAPATIAENIYPRMRFKYRPVFQLQELIETPFWNTLRGVQAAQPVSEDAARIMKELAQISPDFRMTMEADYVLYQAGDEVARRVLSDQSRIGRALGSIRVRGHSLREGVAKAIPEGGVKGVKERGRVAQVFFEHGEYFKESLDKVNPKFFKEMAEAYGTNDPRVVAQKFIEERFRLIDDPNAVKELAGVTDDAALAAFREADAELGRVERAFYKANRQGSLKALEAEGKLPPEIVAAREARQKAADALGSAKAGRAEVTATPRTADEETVMQAFVESWRQSSMQAFKTHYFSPERGWLERTINHPYLGLYPASYMWGKVAPELARFLVRRPFGLDYPMGGLIAYQKVQERMVEAQTDPEFAAFIKDNSDAIYFAQMMLPGLPNEIPVNAPAWSRHLSRDVLSGKEIDPEQFAVRESGDMFLNASPARDVRDLSRAAGDIFDTLTRAASEYDGMFGGQKPAAPPPAAQNGQLRLPPPALP